MKLISKIIKVGAFLSFVLSLAACSTVDINSAEPISIPQNLNKQEVKLAILSAVYPEKAPREWTPVEQMADSALTAYFGYAYSGNSKGHWYVEEVRSDSVLIGFDNRGFYLRVEYIIKGSQIIQRIDGSRGLKQSEDSIHKSVFKWLGGLESKTRQSMGRVSAMKSASNK
jgi:hypothetical protein